MGGKALKSIFTHRLNAEDYHRLVPQVVALVRQVVGSQRQVAVIEAYRTKPDFGDIDILVESNGIRGDYKDALCEALGSREVYHNGSVTSFEYKGFQIDVIMTPSDEFAYAKAYFAWNDLGNLVGRVASRLGFKHGSGGFRLPLVADLQKFAEVTVTRDFDKALGYLGYDPQRFHQGFNTLEEVFEFVASSANFHPWYFILAHRSAYSRNRDSKRGTYLAFLEWVGTHPDFSTVSEKPQDEELGKTAALEAIIADSPEVGDRIKAAYATQAARVSANQKFNATKIIALTGLLDKALGNFIREFKLTFPSDDAFVAWVNNSTQKEVDEAIVAKFNK